MSTPWQCLATLRDVAEVGLPTQANPKPRAERMRALVRASSLAAPYLRKRYGLPLRIFVSAITVDSTTGSGSVAGSPEGDAVDVRIEVLPPGATVASGSLAVKVSLDGGETWGPYQTVPTSGILSVGGLTVTLAGNWLGGQAMEYTVGPDPGIRATVAQIASYLMYYNRGGNPAAMAPYKAGRDEAMEFLRALAKADEAELDQTTDATPGRVERGPLWVATSRSDFLGSGGTT